MGYYKGGTLVGGGSAVYTKVAARTCSQGCAAGRAKNGSAIPAEGGPPVSGGAYLAGSTK